MDQSEGDLGSGLGIVCLHSAWITWSSSGYIKPGFSYLDVFSCERGRVDHLNPGDAVRSDLLRFKIKCVCCIEERRVTDLSSVFLVQSKATPL